MLVCFIILKYYDIDTSNLNIASKVFMTITKVVCTQWPAGYGHDFKWGAILLGFYFLLTEFFFLGCRTSWTLFNILTITIQHCTDYYSTSVPITIKHCTNFHLASYRSLIQNRTNHHSTSYRSLFDIIPITIQHRTDHCSTPYRSLFNIIPIIIPILIQHRTNHHSTSHRSFVQPRTDHYSTLYWSPFNIM